MSLHHFRANGHTVTAGWDRPLQSFHLTITTARRRTPLYCNLHDPALLGAGGGLTLPQLLDVLRRYGLVVPDALARELAADQSANAGNRLVTYHADGTVHDEGSGRCS